MPKIPCPICHGTGTVDIPNSPRDTLRMKREVFEALVPAAIPTPLPPPLEKVEIQTDPEFEIPTPVNRQGEVTMSDKGWFERHMREQNKNARRRGLALTLVVLWLAFTIGYLQFCARGNDETHT